MTVSPDVGEYSYKDNLVIVLDAANEASRIRIAETPSGTSEDTGPVIQENVPVDATNKRLVQIYPGRHFTTLLANPAPSTKDLTMVRQTINGKVITYEGEMLEPDVVVQVGYDGEVMDGHEPAGRGIRTYAVFDGVPMRVERTRPETSLLVPITKPHVIFVDTGNEERIIVANMGLHAVHMHREAKQTTKPS